MILFQFVAFLTIFVAGWCFKTSFFNQKTTRNLGIALAVSSLSFIVAYQIAMIIIGYDIRFDLPLHLCGLMAILGSLAIIFKWLKVLKFLAAPAFCGPLLSLLFPYNPKGSELAREVFFFSYHTVLILISLYTIWVLKEKLAKQDYFNSILFVFYVGMTSIGYNHWIGGNYVFTMEPILKTKLFLENIVVYRMCFFLFMCAYMAAFHICITKVLKPSVRLEVINTKRKRHLG